MQIFDMMKTFLIKVFIFFCVIFFLDVLLGFAFNQMLSGAVGGNNGRINYICNHTNEELLVLGSSRANHHYNPKILTDSLGETCYNCGEDGNGIILNYGRILMMLQRYRPKMIIYDVAISFDLLKNDNHKYLGKLKPYYEREHIKDVFCSVDKAEQWKMLSQLYRFNSSFLTIIADRFHPVSGMGIQGFCPLEGKMDMMKIHKDEDRSKEYQFDSLKVDFINKFIDKLEGVKIVFVESPLWYGMDSLQLTPLREICRQRNIPLIDFSNNPKFVGNNEFFKDGSHLNSRGADEFTKDLIIEMKNRRILD